MSQIMFNLSECTIYYEFYCFIIQIKIAETILKVCYKILFTPSIFYMKKTL